MKKQPTLKTARLLLRPFILDDAPEVQRLAGDREIASTTLNIPHPYEDGLAEKWISSHKKAFEEAKLANFAIVHQLEKYLIGAISLNINSQHESAEMGYWIGRPYWGNDYGTEAARAMLRYGFKDLKLNRIYARYMTRNPASGRVMEKIGMEYEGCLRKHVKKWGIFEDLNVYGILRSQYQSMEL